MSARLLLSCGEASGDLYAGALIRELLSIDPSLAISGLGGPRFAAAGGRLVDDYRELSVTGLTEWIPKLPRLLANGDYGTLEHPRLVVGALSVHNDRDLPRAVLEQEIDIDLGRRSKSFVHLVFVG